jgi:rubrerythrin
VAWERISDHPLSTAETRCLTYMMDIESHTMVFMRDLLATRAAMDAQLTAFLACWAYEELWHGEALSRFLGEAGLRLAPDPDIPGWDDPYPSRVARIARIRAGALARGRVSHHGVALASRLFGGFPATHMAWGAINELSTLTAYGILLHRTSNPVLADLLARIMRDEKRHYSYYRVEADRRLSADGLARRVTRVALDRSWAVVGTGVRPLKETDFVVLHLFGDGDDGLRAVHAMDRTVDGLPGLHGLRLFQRARAAAISRAGSALPASRHGARAGSCSIDS